MEYYVYQLRINDQTLPFYIGKGMGDRCYQHFDEKVISNHFKTRTIKKALQSGKQVLVEKIVENLDEELAFLVEEECISKFGRVANGGCLTNLTDGGAGGNTLTDPEVKKKWENAMVEVNNRPEVRKKRSDSAKAIWTNLECRNRILESRAKFYESDESLDRKKQVRFQSWTFAKDKWLLAETIYDLWIANNKCGYHTLATKLTEFGHPYYHLQKMVKYFKTTNPFEDIEYQEWKTF